MDAKVEEYMQSCHKCGGCVGRLLPLMNGKWICEGCLGGEEKPSAPRITKRNWNELVSPKDLNSFIGQEVIKREIRTMLDAAKKSGIPVQHVLFSGSFGLGKTTLANIFAGMIGHSTYVTAANIRGEFDFPKSPVVVVTYYNGQKRANHYRSYDNGW
jgi:hypothetical protein